MELGDRCARFAFAVLAGIVLAAGLYESPPAAAQPPRAGSAAKPAQPPWALPRPNRFDTTPACPVSEAHPVCLWRHEPPYDPQDREGQPPYYSSADYFTNCAYWAAEKRPDVEQLAIERFGYHPASLGAAAWRGDAVRAGYSVDHRPRVGDIAVWVPPLGRHVAYVERLGAGDSVVVSEMDLLTAKGPSGATQWLPGSLAAQLWYIHLEPKPRLVHPGHGPGTTLAHRAEASMHPRLVSTSADPVRLVFAIAPGSGSAKGVASYEGSVVALTARVSSPGVLVISGKLPAGLWSVAVTWLPAAGFERPPETVVGLEVP